MSLASAAFITQWSDIVSLKITHMAPEAQIFCHFKYFVINNSDQLSESEASNKEWHANIFCGIRKLNEIFFSK